MQHLLTLSSYLFVGFIEMFLITQRTALISRKKNKAAAGVVFIENFIAFFIIWQLAKDVTNNIPGFIAYTIGSCSGTVLDIENFTYDKILRKSKKIWFKFSKTKAYKAIHPETA
jgi:uncharacterized protein YebE (UPF0316 family)